MKVNPDVHFEKTFNGIGQTPVISSVSSDSHGSIFQKFDPRVIEARRYYNAGSPNGPRDYEVW